MRSVALALALLAAAAPPLSAQATARDSVLAAVNVLFAAINGRDSTAAALGLRPEGHMFAVVESGDSVMVRRTLNTSFQATIHRSPQVMLERLWAPTVMIHKHIAIVWAPYDFHRDGAFSHCGVDVFTVIRDRAGWRVSDATYTVEPKGCAPSPLGPPKP